MYAGEVVEEYKMSIDFGWSGNRNMQGGLLIVRPECTNNAARDEPIYVQVVQ